MGDFDTTIQSDEFADEYDFAYEDNLSDAEADAETFASAGWGTDEDYGYYGGGDDW